MMSSKKGDYKAAKSNEDKNQIIADLISHWKRENPRGRFIRVYNGIAYELSDTTVKGVVRRFLLSTTIEKAGVETISETSPATPRRLYSILPRVTPASGASQVKVLWSTQLIPLEDNAEEADETPSSPIQERHATLEALFEEVEEQPFLSFYAEFVQRVVDSRSKGCKRKAAPCAGREPPREAARTRSPPCLNPTASPLIRETTVVDVTSHPLEATITPPSCESVVSVQDLDALDSFDLLDDFDHLLIPLLDDEM
jgi:hypothetical protein